MTKHLIAIWTGVAAPLLILQATILPVRAIQTQQSATQVEPTSARLAQVPQKLTRRQDRYHVTLTLPSTSAIPLAAVRIEQSGNLEQPLTFDLDKTQAFNGSSAHLGEEIALQAVTQPEASQIQVTFARPVQPGETITITLKPERLPSSSQTYQFAISALSATQAEFLGYQQLSVERDRQYPWAWNRDDVFPFYSETDHRVLFWDLPPEFDSRTRRR